MVLAFQLHLQVGLVAITWIKKLIKMKTFVLIALTFFSILTACEKPPGARSMRGLWVKNNSSIRICTFTGFQYPDTSIPDLSERKWDLETILPSNEKVYDFPIKRWEQLFDKLPADTLSLFVFHADTIAKYSWEKIQSEYNILKRYDISLEDLKNMNSTIQYP